MPTPVVFSWSAGKDSAFGLWTLLRDPGLEVRALLTTLTEGYDRVSMSGVRDELLSLQAEAIGQETTGTSGQLNRLVSRQPVEGTSGSTG